MDKKIIYIPEYMYVLSIMEKYQGQSLSDMCYNEGITYSQLHKINKEFIKLELVEYIKRNIKLTEKGILVINKIKDLYKDFNINNTELFRIRRVKNKYLNIEFDTNEDKIAFNKLSKQEKEDVYEQYMESVKQNGRN